MRVDCAYNRIFLIVAKYKKASGGSSVFGRERNIRGEAAGLCRIKTQTLDSDRQNQVALRRPIRQTLKLY